MTHSLTHVPVTLSAGVDRVSSDKLAPFLMLMRPSLEEQVETEKLIQGILLCTQV